MAYLIFKNEEGLVRTETTFLRAAKTEADAQLVHKGHLPSVEMINITDEEYDSFLRGDLSLKVINEVPSFENNVWPDPVPDEYLIPNQENFENYLSIEGIEVNLALALSVLNAQKIVEFIKYFEYLEHPEIIGISMTPVWYPQELCISNLNDDAKNYLLNIYEQYPQYKDKLWTAYNMINSPRETYDIKGYIDNLDKRAKKSGMYPNYKSFSEVEPDWYNLL